MIFSATIARNLEVHCKMSRFTTIEHFTEHFITVRNKGYSSVQAQNVTIELHDRDRGLYAPGQNWLARKDVVGRARGFLPYVGIVTIIMNEYPKFKYAVLACLGFYVLIHRE